MDKTHNLRKIRTSIKDYDNKDKYIDMFIMFRLVQTPWRMISAFIGVVHSLLALLFWSKEPTDQDIITYVLETSMCILVRQHPDRPDTYTAQVDRCVLKFAS